MTGIKVGDYHTYADFGLKMLSFEAPEPKVRKILKEVPGRQGFLDLSESLTGEPLYENRPVVGEFDMEEPDPKVANEKLREIRDCLHGKRLKIIDDNEPDYYYEGRISVETQRKNNIYYTVLISADADPFKLKLRETVMYFNIPLGESVVVCKNERMSVVPTLRSVSNVVSVYVDGEYVSVPTNKDSKFENLKFVEGDNVIKVSCNQQDAKLKVVYQEGGL